MRARLLPEAPTVGVKTMPPASQSTQNDSDVVRIAKDYYNSHDADNFYATVWGGEDIHIGLYATPDESIADASHRTVERMAASLGQLDQSTKVLDVGSGYGGTARYLARTFGCHVTALNLSEVENERNRALNQAAGLSAKIDVVDGNFEAIPYEEDHFDAVVSQDAILHSGDRSKVIAEVARVLKPGGTFVFTDPMQADDCPPDVLEPILARIHLDTLGSPAFYRQEARKHGMEEIGFERLTHQLANHYRRVLEETEAHAAELEQKISPQYLANMKKGLRHWVNGGESGYLVWGIFQFRN